MSSILKVDTIQEKTSNNTVQLGNTVSEDVVAATSSSGTLTLNAAEGGFFTVALSENVTTWTISNLPSGRATVITVRFTQDSSDRTVVSTINSTTAKTAGGAGGNRGNRRADYVPQTPDLPGQKVDSTQRPTRKNLGIRLWQRRAQISTVPGNCRMSPSMARTRIDPVRVFIG